MSAATAGDPHAAEVPSSQPTEKKHKRSKSDHKKKRLREDDDGAVVAETPRKQKKTKSESADEAEVEKSHEVVDEKVEKKKKKKSKEEGEDGTNKKEKKSKRRESAVMDAMDVDGTEEKTEKKKKKDKKRIDDTQEAEPSDEEKKDKKKKKHKPKEPVTMDIPIREAQPSTDIPSDSDFPFYTQTISLYVPFFPAGFDKPLTNIAAQHLDPLLNHYSPILRGVLLSYSNLNLSDRPVRASTIHPPTDQTPALLHSINEYAVGFGWLTFDAHLFVPARGKWMEGVVQLQNEGHIGVVCWNKFNASIEAKRLPKGWRWVDLAKGNANPKPEPPAEEQPQDSSKSDSSDALDGEELQVIEQMHTTGYWVTAQGKRVSGKLRFRIKNFDVGLAGDYGYLSIEGTCLDDAEEQALAAQEREMERQRRAKQQARGGLLRPMSRRVPEFSMTRFGREEQEEDGQGRAVLYRGSRPGTPDD
ncbi:DNA-dependent RNA polymerase I subunit a43-like protein [Thermochaetoides thermophila DSM 1495]|uniref:DNA-directed RNA polymerase subunit n=1 Tax=Chaetomium thermophilum (strain DSM 1495 / CBS 144.50 / IMI 039719) TaxID=759272 RepID=G0SAD7_CHATD|nr:DNA-dependent RNA polymerase I subunit a43-like protein [Thermochaetoides thermophila DSM 1495]EGS19709.1 DNA-dependent RNA polymerase I subunit a43-like protein [Thermochaetoides thermophila DSM 1495]